MKPHAEQLHAHKKNKSSFSINTIANTIDLMQHEASGNTPQKLCSYSPEPLIEVYCFRLNFDISKLVYSELLLPLFQDESWCTTYHMEMRFSSAFIVLQIKLISIERLCTRTRFEKEIKSNSE